MKPPGPKNYIQLLKIIQCHVLKYTYHYYVDTDKYSFDGNFRLSNIILLRFYYNTSLTPHTLIQILLLLSLQETLLLIE